MQSPQHEGAVIAAGAVPLLVALLRSDEPAVQEQAAGALGGLHHSKDTIIAAGAVPLLVALLSSEQPDVQATALRTLRNIRGNRWFFRSSVKSMIVKLPLTFFETA